ncbi:hypothetical protein KKH96_02515 [Patescibacteria group bacterium]|nr:hypothetical protein [Patescibacteria group bacterium]
MPKIYEYKCDICGFDLPEGWGGCMYVEDDNGKRITCDHPCEGEAIGNVLGKNPSKELLKKRVGFNSDCICLDCLHQFKADLSSKGLKDKDKRECPKCKSEKVKTISELVNKPCPKCHKGTIKEIETGIWT